MIVLTNGQHYVTTDASGKIKKIQDIEQKHRHSLHVMSQCKSDTQSQKM